MTEQPEPECCGAEPPRELTGTDGLAWTTGDCWCTLPPHTDGQHRCQPCTDQHGAPGWTDKPARDGGPDVAEAAQADRNWDVERHGE